MDNDREIIEAFEKAFPADEAQRIDQSIVDKACETVFKKAAEQFGPEGIYVFGRLNPDMGGVSFRFKRPAIRQRVEHFIICNVGRKKEAKKESNTHTGSSDASNSNAVSSGSINKRLSRLIELADQMGDDDFTKGGKPDVNVLNELLDEGEADFTAAERNELWKQMSEK